MNSTEAPPLPGNWVSGVDIGTGAWSIGLLWFDRAKGLMALKVGAEHCNAYGTLHGGAMATYADGQAGAVIEYHEDDPEGHTPTISLSVDYLAPVPVGAWLVADVTLLKVTRTMIFTQAVMTVGERVVARTNAIYRNVPGKVPL
jgi:uncharacterized protein (TIGR00369 family)